MVRPGPTALAITSRRRAPVANLWHGILPAVILMAGFFLAPIGYTIGLSFTTADHGGPTLANYAAFFANDRFTDALMRSIVMATAAVTLASAIAYPLAWFLTYAVHPRRRLLLLFLLIAPFWTSFTIRAFSWQLVLSDSGVIAFFSRTAAGPAGRVRLPLHHGGLGVWPGPVRDHAHYPDHLQRYGHN